jgi:predicted transcriptional regulator
MPKSMTLRLSDDQAAELDVVARVDDTSVSAVVRVAIGEYVERRRQDQEFKTRLREIVERDREILERLAK